MLCCCRMVQVGDKGWMNEEDRFCDVYRKGASDFIDFAYSNKIKSSPLCPCPCHICRNKYSLSFALVKYHLEIHLIDKSYVLWCLHGEKSTTSSQVVLENVEENVDVENVGVDNVEEEISIEEHVEENISDEQSRLGYFVDKAYGIFEGLNKDVNEGGEETDLGKKYHKYKELAKEKIYPGYEGDEKTLSVIVELQHMKKMFGWSGNSVTYLLGRLKNWLPKGNTFPVKYPTMKSMLIDIGMKAESFMRVLIIVFCTEKKMRRKLCVPTVEHLGM
ncbi:uncharacterized protein LOC113347941 [Papaver somniferum]|uniref:uncharacterized protein LOC113347941 n=1 Tax=Papaver somniferum TaxID=3469 RepID=UPI000E6F5DC4|nr:uncharacterized protein LOC113347941 [Papaver somniferum]